MKNIITFLLVFFTATTVWAEKVIVSGTVVDSNKEPLIGVNVTVKDAPGLGTITDIDGRYRIEIDAYSTLLFSYIGFDTYKVLIKENMKVVNVQMKESSNNVIDEVVITGTGAQKKISVTGAITTVGVKELQTAPGGNLSNALAGNVPGIMAMQTSGQPGQNTSEFWIRGISTFGANTSALVLVDGFERDLNDVNIEDIESFSVLKDASATAIYGSRGANGVVLITTKHGGAGKINIDAKVETSYNTRTITPEFADGINTAKLLQKSEMRKDIVIELSYKGFG